MKNRDSASVGISVRADTVLVYVSTKQKPVHIIVAETERH